MPLSKICVITAGVSQIRLVKSTTVLTPTQQQQLERINQSGHISGISGQLTGQIQGISGIQGIVGKMAPNKYQLIKTTAGMGLQANSPVPQTTSGQLKVVRAAPTLQLGGKTVNLQIAPSMHAKPADGAVSNETYLNLQKNPLITSKLTFN